MAIRLENEAIDGPLSRELESLSETRLAQCYQCGKCSAGCPVAAEMDMLPNQVMRLAQLGQFDDVLRGETIWVCASCVTCTTRCPREVEIAAVMDGLRQMALEKRVASKRSREIYAFHKAFLDAVRAFGRMAEFTMVGDYKMRSFKFFQDIFTAPKMLLRGKLHFLPKPVRGRREVRKIFKKCGC
jgi:heterodisulfide reductase subunit C